MKITVIYSLTLLPYYSAILLEQQCSEHEEVGHLRQRGDERHADVVEPLPRLHQPKHPQHAQHAQDAQEGQVGAALAHQAERGGDRHAEVDS